MADLASNLGQYWQEAKLIYSLVNGDIDPITSIDPYSPLNMHVADTEQLFVCFGKLKEGHFPVYIPCYLDDRQYLCFENPTAESILVSYKIDLVKEDLCSQVVQEMQLNAIDPGVYSLFEMKNYIQNIFEEVNLTNNFDDYNTTYLFKINVSEGGGEDLVNDYLLAPDTRMNTRDKNKQPQPPVIYLSHSSDKYSLSGEQRYLLSKMLSPNGSNVFYASIVNGSGGKTVLDNYIAHVWAKAIIDGSYKPNTWKIENNELVPYTIFSNDKSGWLSSKDQEQLVKLNPIEDKNEIRKKYLLNASKHFQKNISCVDQILRTLRAEIANYAMKLKEGETLLYIEHELSQQISTQYKEYGGVEKRAKEISINLSKARDNLNEVKVLLSFWRRQYMELPFYYKHLKNVLYVSQRILNKLERFFSPTISSEELSVLTIACVEEKIISIVQRKQKKIRGIEDKLLQVESHKKQLDLARARKEKWLLLIGCEDGSIDHKISHSLDINIRYRVHVLSVRAWEASLLSDKSTESFNKTIDFLVVDNAQSTLTMAVWEHISRASKLVAIKRPFPKIRNYIPEGYDDNLALKYNLIDDEYDLYDLQFEGYAASRGTICNWLECKYGEDAEPYLSSIIWAHSKAINYLMHSIEPGVFFDRKIPVSYTEGDINFISVDREVSTAPLGYINHNEALSIIDILKGDRDNEVSTAIATTTYAQKSHIQQLLVQNNIHEVPVFVCSSSIKTDFGLKEQVICSLVFDSSFVSSKSFEDKEFWMQMGCIAKDNITVVSHPSLFPKNSHSVMGVIAKSLEIHS